VPLSLGWQDFLSAYLIYQVFSFDIDEMCSLFVVGQICADALRHHHDECAVIHVHPISSTDQFIRRVANEWTAGRLKSAWRFTAQWFVETVAVSRQGGSHRSIHLRSVNFWSGKLRCTESKNW
jgi:hypothetical protein